jgi:hypothetical protein
MEEKIISAEIPKQSFLDFIKFFAELSTDADRCKMDEESKQLANLMFVLYSRYFKVNNKSDVIHLAFTKIDVDQTFNGLLSYFNKIKSEDI